MKKPSYGFDTWSIHAVIFKAPLSGLVHVHVSDQAGMGEARKVYDAILRKEDGWSAVMDVCDPVATQMKGQVIRLFGGEELPLAT